MHGRGRPVLGRGSRTSVRFLLLVLVAFQMGLCVFSLLLLCQERNGSCTLLESL
jgi:hypothetical protein